jgi:peptidoglycan/LPS O-acetylase OafA/YrhL
VTSREVPVAAPRAVHGAPTARRGDHAVLATRRNSLNLIRLVLALAVLVFHAYPLGGFTGKPTLLGVGLGGWAVAGFFCLSGYLIQASRDSRPVETYLMLRIARIFPAYWVCLVVTAFVFAPAAYVMAKGTIDGFLTSGPTAPLDYVLTNAFLRINSYAVGDTLTTVPYPVAWNGSLWTLYYEFICYLALAVLGVFAWWRGRIAVLVALAAVTALAVGYPHVAPYVGNDPHVANLVALAPYFFAGAAVYRWRDRVPLTWPVALLSAGLVVGASALDPQRGPVLTAAAFATALLYLGTVLPSPRWVRGNDVSYGVYIYAFPVQQLLVVFGVHTAGLWPYVIATTALTALAAVGSWYAIERPALRTARRRLDRRSGRSPVEAVPAGESVAAVGGPAAVGAAVDADRAQVGAVATSA